VGEHHVANALAAVAVARECGIPMAAALRQVAALGPASPHRMAVLERSDGVTIVDDSYNASPESMRAALRALKDIAAGGRTVAVLGEMREMGDSSRAAHEAIGVDAVRLDVTRLLVVGQGARPIYEAALREGSWGDEAAFVATIEEAHEHLDGYLASGDTVLVKASQGSGLWRLADELVGEG
jgi:UDP-N-acetylmuramoyl-tripeptide--D-alanyl-D-alanine ligase